MNEPESRWNTGARPPQVPEINSEGRGDGQGSMLAHGTPPHSAGEMELQAILGAGTAFQGTLSFAGHVRIDGQFEGSAQGGELLVIGEGSRVSGKIRASRVIILGGRVEADIFAEVSIELYVPAVVSGDLKSPQIYMDRGIQFQGTCDMTAEPPLVEELPPR